MSRGLQGNESTAMERAASKQAWPSQGDQLEGGCSHGLIRPLAPTPAMHTATHTAVDTTAGLLLPHHYWPLTSA
jgi:hypothetical protein